MRRSADRQFPAPEPQLPPRSTRVEPDAAPVGSVLDLASTNGTFIEPLGELADLAHRAGIPVYGTISASGMRGPENRYSTLEAWRGAASNMWRAGVDGIVAFNQFPMGPEPRFQDIGSPQTLASKDKLFVIDPVRILEGDLVQGIEQAQALPLTIPADGRSVRCTLPIGDDLLTAHQRQTLRSAELRVHLSDPKAQSIEVRLNRHLLAAAEEGKKEGWLVYRPEPSQYRVGDNQLAFRGTAPSPGEALAAVLHVEVPVVYKTPAAGGR